MKYQARILGQARHVLQAVGVYLIAAGYADDATIQAIIGGFMALGSMVWSWTDPAKKAGRGD